MNTLIKARNDAIKIVENIDTKILEVKRRTKQDLKY